MPCVTPSPPELSFELATEGSAHNLVVLERYNLDLGEALKAQMNSPLGPGREFRPTSVLCSIFSCHTLWPKMKAFLDEGSKWPLDSIREEARKKKP